MAHSSDSHEIPLVRLDPLPNGLRLAGPVLTIIGLLVFVAALFIDPARAWHAYLFNWVWAYSIAQGAVVLAAVTTIAKGLWARPLRRYAISWVGFLPIGYLLMLPILIFGADQIFPWIEHPVPGKEAYLNMPFLTVRNVLGLGALIGVSLYFAYVTLRPDLGLMRDSVDARLHPLYMRLTRGWRGQEPEEFQAYRKLSVLSPVMVLLYALGFTFLGFDFLMSLEPHWFSTLYGPYLFMGAFLGGIALTTVVAVAYSRRHDFAGVVSPSGFHDLGKMFLGMTIFWAYLFFSHYIVIWYGKLPLEQEYLIHRLVMPFRITSSIVFFMLFVIPFFGMLSVAAKRHARVLMIFALISLVGLWLERYTLVYPSLYIGTETLPLGWREIGVLPLFLGLMLMAHGWFASRFPMFQSWQPFSELELQGVEFDAGVPSGTSDPVA
jgi:hypothetical protein